MAFDRLNACQDGLIARVSGKKELLFPGSDVILAGGTALARCYLHHRVSYDLDFFVSRRFAPELIERRLRDEGIVLREPETESDPNYAAQLTGLVEEGGEEIRIAFIEDIHSGMFPTAEVEGIKTETIKGLYHRKIRTICGTGEAFSSTGRPLHQGGRQTARDLFDLYVLGMEVKPLGPFLTEINGKGANIPEAALESGIRRMPWRDLMDEFEALEVAERYEGVGLFDVKRGLDEALAYLAGGRG